jgi:DNA polymerase I-like protein with 3'-5' exonuclease and polymerase domains
MYNYAAIDTCATLELYTKFKPIVDKNPKLLNLYNQLLIPALSALIDIELVGVPLDKRRLEFAKEGIDAAIEKAVIHLYTLSEVTDFEAEQGAKFNPNSVVQLRKLLFDKLKLDPLAKKTGTGLQSTDAEVLESLNGQHEVVDSIIKIRKLGKIKNTYVDNLLLNLDKDGRVRTGFNLTSTTSGRLSSSGKFNAQQLPRDEKRIKGAIKGTGKYEGWKIVSQD